MVVVEAQPAVACNVSLERWKEESSYSQARQGMSKSDKRLNNTQDSKY